VQRDAVEDLDLGTILDHQPFHHVKAVQFPPLRGDLGQMPTRWWGRATGASLAVQGPPSFEDPVDGPHRGERFDLAALEGLVNGICPVEPQVTGLLQLVPHGQDQILDGGFGPCCRLGSAGAIVPVHSIEPLAAGVLDPMMDHGLADMEFVGDRVLRSTISDGGDDGSAARGLPITLLMAASGERCGFSVQITAD